MKRSILFLAGALFASSVFANEMSFVVKGKVETSEDGYGTSVMIHSPKFLAVSDKIDKKNMAEFMLNAIDIRGFGALKMKSSPLVVSDCAEAIVTIEASKGNVLPNDPIPGSNVLGGTYTPPSVLNFTCIN